MDQQELADSLAAFGGSPGERRVVARQATDMAAVGLPDHFDRELTASDVVATLGEAPDDYTLVGRWNWWVGALELSHGGYHRFRVRR